MREARLIQDPGELEAALFRLRSSDRLALDTEFMRERTYHAQLCLVQIATESDCYLIDPLVGLDLAPLHELLQDRSKLKILHAARQDLEVLSLASGQAPAGPMFDTQIAAALLGLPAQIGYGDLVARQLGHSLDKGQTRTDWSRGRSRPSRWTTPRTTSDYLAHAARPTCAQPCVAKGRADWLDRRNGLPRKSRAVPRRDPEDWRGRRLKGLEPPAAGTSSRRQGAGRTGANGAPSNRISRAAGSWRTKRSMRCATARPGVDRRAGVRPDACRRRVIRKGGQDELLELLRAARADESGIPRHRGRSVRSPSRWRSQPACCADPRAGRNWD